MLLSPYGKNSWNAYSEWCPKADKKYPSAVIHALFKFEINSDNLHIPWQGSITFLSCSSIGLYTPGCYDVSSL